jgi:FkbM family methyltransferase
MLAKLYGDFVGLRRVCGTGVALRWMGHVTARLGTCVKQRNLQAADAAMGEGPFVVRHGPVRARLAGFHVVSSIREIWGRNLYLGEMLTLPTRGTVVDLGANRGYFATVAAAAGPDVRVVAVEASRVGCRAIGELARLNAIEGRVTVVNRFIGGDTPAQHDAHAIPEAEGVGFITADELIDQYGIERIDFLKCDVEGSEFELLQKGRRVLARTEQLAMEVHDSAGDRGWLMDVLRKNGFEVVLRSDDVGSCIVNARRRRPSTDGA